MSIDTVQEQPKKQVSKKLIAILIAAVVLIGGAASAFYFFNSPKEQYFLAEKNTANFFASQFEERFKHEIEWSEHSRNNPINDTIEISAEMNDPDEFFADTELQQMINNSSITVNAAYDLKNKIFTSDLEANISDIKFDGIGLYLTNKDLMLALPFVDELLKIDETNLNKLLNEVDPYTFPDDEPIKFEYLFDQMHGEAYKEDWEYVKSKYLKFLFEELPKEAFTTTKDEITIGNEKMKANKITMSLSEKEIKTLLHALLDKMENDKKLEEIIERNSSQLGYQSREISKILRDFKKDLRTAKKHIDSDLHIPNGLTSTIWTKKNLIVQREISVEFGPEKDDLIKININGTQQLEKNKQTVDYDIHLEDYYMETNLHVTGDFTFEDKKATDSIIISFDDHSELFYNGTETLDGNKKDFEREIGVDSYEFAGSLIWSGNSTFEKDKMRAEHQLALDVDELQPNILSLNIHTDSKTVKEVTLPKDKSTKDIGAMDVDELMDYVETDIMPELEDWVFRKFGSLMLQF